MENKREDFNRVFEIVSKYKSSMPCNATCYMAGAIKDRVLAGAMNSIAPDESKEDIVAVLDVTVFGSGKNGVVFTPYSVYYRDLMSESIEIIYASIEEVRVLDKSKDDNKRTIEFRIDLEYSETIRDSFINKTPFCECIKEILAYYEEKERLLEIESSQYDDGEDDDEEITKDDYIELFEYTDVLLLMTMQVDDQVYTCTNCKKLYSEYQKFCGDCGSPIEASKTPNLVTYKNRIMENKCVYCGNDVGNDLECNRCGLEVLKGNIPSLIHLYAKYHANQISKLKDLKEVSISDKDQEKEKEYLRILGEIIIYEFIGRYGTTYSTMLELFTSPKWVRDECEEQRLTNDDYAWKESCEVVQPRVLRDESSKYVGKRICFSFCVKQVISLENMRKYIGHLSYLVKTENGIPKETSFTMSVYDKTDHDLNIQSGDDLIVYGIYQGDYKLEVKYIKKCNV